jgi:hypothetical protein
VEKSRFFLFDNDAETEAVGVLVKLVVGVAAGAAAPAAPVGLPKRRRRREPIFEDTDEDCCMVRKDGVTSFSAMAANADGWWHIFSLLMEVPMSLTVSGQRCFF